MRGVRLSTAPLLFCVNGCVCPLSRLRMLWHCVATLGVAREHGKACVVSVVSLCKIARQRPCFSCKVRALQQSKTMQVLC